MTDDELVAAALNARTLAYAPYSNFAVGAAVLADDGRVFVGCNIENASYGLTNCAERTALFNAIAGGVPARTLHRLAVVGDTGRPLAPCGACRQVMLELGGPQLEVVLANLQGARERTTAAALLPGAFDAGALP
ncbi:cytidine deaminase [Caldimonas brevitalea]|uniref:Cytidine deaminase n=1 Tax=Caldimonas brevitalea TaxID=413882 RepID=A0A0G3BMG5_9BURK|nr:cytidine deaminase [Caldimonas brevitalea]AKJ29173.1 cytidine deaminase [Caldimonas brevitalea]